MQSKRGSLIEAIVNTGIGFLVTLICSPFIYYLCGIRYTAAQLGMATLMFTVISIIRGYVIRRYFNKAIKKAIYKN